MTENESQTLALAPAAGAGIGKEIATELLSRAGFVQKMADSIERGLVAQRRIWDSGAKQWVEEPDIRSQLQAFAIAMAHMEGEPVKRIIHQHLGGAGTVDPLAALKESPALREAAADLLRKAEWKTSGSGAHKRPKKVSPVVDAEPAADSGNGAF